MKTEIIKVARFGKTEYAVYFENTTDPQPYAGLVGNYPTLAAAKKAAAQKKATQSVKSA